MSTFNLAGGRGRYLLLLVCILAILTASKTDGAHDNKQIPSNAAFVKRRSSSSYCGLYCLYTTMKMADKEIDFRELVKPEYIGSRKGSSLEDLKKAAEDNGLYAVPVGKLTSQVLRNCPHPVILHVKSDTTSREYDHYELFLGTKNGQARLFNPPEPVRLVPFRKLARRWDGNGLIVSAEQIDLGAIFAPARKRFIMYAVVAIAIILALRWAKRWLPKTLLNSRRRLLELSAAQGAALGIAALICGMIYHFANDEGFLAHANATNSVQQAHIANFVPKISRKKVAKLLNSDTVIIDAKLARDFDAGHIEGAINVPVDICDKGFSAALTGIDKNARIVVYCQSASCPFAIKTTKRLKDNGFSNISIFKGGWNEWKTKENK